MFLLVCVAGLSCLLYIIDMDKSSQNSSIATGVDVIVNHLKALPTTPGVYRMIGEAGDVLYVGKAKSLKARVRSYTHFDKLTTRLQRMVSLTRQMEFVHTQTEVEALLLESNLIKRLKPRYNILLRDDKSFPYILLTGHHDYPQVKKHRGAKKPKGEYFGPFASAGNVNKTIAALQRAFLLRNCSDNIFANRARPCLQYHIQRCTAPCTGEVTQEEYVSQVEQAAAFLSGESKAVQDSMVQKMHAASDSMDYEEAAKYRDRIRALTAIQVHQDINVAGLQDADVIALSRQAGQSCVQAFFFRGGCNYGNRAYFPRHQAEDCDEDILGAFLAQFYEHKPVPRDVIVSHMPTDNALLEAALSERAGIKVKIHKPQRGKRVRVIDFAMRNAKAALQHRVTNTMKERAHLESVAALFGLDDVPARIEVYDNSHISGSNMVGAMIVAGEEGFMKNAYRKFNIREADASDDYGMMREVMQRRFKRALKEEEETGQRENWPDLLLIDGGQGQYNTVRSILEEYGVADDVAMVAIAKGEDRNAGREKFFMQDKAPFQLPVDDPTLHYLQRLRDEAHRFAIGTHRVRRRKDIEASPLDGVSGIGAKRKKALLTHFGSGKAVADAGVDDLQKVDGISKSMAQKIYDHFH